jgi:carbon monoxide dehydrogenase subunit G
MAMQTEVSIEIGAAPDAVWGLLMQPDRYPEFMDPAEEMVDLGDGTVQVGYEYSAKGGVPPFKSTTSWSVTTFEPNTYQVHDGDDGQMKIHADWRITATETGCTLNHTAEMEPVWYVAPVMAVMWPLLMRKRVEEAMNRTMANVKRLAEADGS